MDPWTETAHSVIASCAAEVIDAGKARLTVSTRCAWPLIVLDPVNRKAARMEVIATATQVDVTVADLATHEIWAQDEAQRLAELAICVQAVVEGRCHVEVTLRSMRHLPALWRTSLRPTQRLTFASAERPPIVVTRSGSDDYGEIARRTFHAYA